MTGQRWILVGFLAAALALLGASLVDEDDSPMTERERHMIECAWGPEDC